MVMLFLEEIVQMLIFQKSPLSSLGVVVSQPACPAFSNVLITPISLTTQNQEKRSLKQNGTGLKSLL